MRNSALVLVLLSSLAQGCADEAPDATPEGALGELIDALEESRYDDERRADVYALLDEGSRQELAARAARAEALGRSGLEPWEMIAIGRARLAFEPTQMSARVDGDRAVVVAQGRGGRRAEVPVVREPEGWRVVLFAEAPAHGSNVDEEATERATPDAPSL